MKRCCEDGNERRGDMTGKRETACPAFSGPRARTGIG